MTTEPKLLTEAEWRNIWRSTGTYQPFPEWVEPYRERGLIAEEPDAIHRLAAEICAKLLGTGSSAAMVKEVEGMIRRRGLELAPRKELTREMVEEMTFPACDAAYRDVYCDRVPEVETAYVKAFARHFHAALTEALQ